MVLYFIFLKWDKISHQLHRDKNSLTSGLSKVTFIVYLAYFPFINLCHQFKTWSWHRTSLLFSFSSFRRAGHPAISSDTEEGLKSGTHDRDQDSSLESWAWLLPERFIPLVCQSPSLAVHSMLAMDETDTLTPVILLWSWDCVTFIYIFFLKAPYMVAWEGGSEGCHCLLVVWSWTSYLTSLRLFLSL